MRDAETELTEPNVRLWIDGAKVGINDRGYDQATDTLFHTPYAPLSVGTHTVKVVAIDAQGLGTTKQWSFTVA